MTVQPRIESSYSIYTQLAQSDSDTAPASGESTEMRHFMRLFLAVQAEMNQAMTTLSLDALEMKIQELMTAADKIQDEGEKAAAAQRSAAITSMVAGSVQVAGGAASIRAGERVRVAKVDYKVAEEQLKADPGNYALFQTTLRRGVTLAQRERSAGYSKLLGESSGQLGTSIGQVDAAQLNEEASSRRRDQKIAEAESARADAQQSGAGQFIQQNLQSASAQLQLYRELLQEKNQMEKTANRVV